MRLAGRTAIVTGAGAGIGQAIARRLAQEGADVVVADIRAETVPGVVAEVEAHGRRALGITVDVTKRHEVREMIARTIEALGKVDILVNNAGSSNLLYSRTGQPALDPLTARMATKDMPEQFFDAQIALNLKGVFLCCQAVLDHMQQRRYGRIVNVSSIDGRASRVAKIVGVGYSSAKGGVLALTRHLAEEVGPLGITVNAVAPGVTMTERLRRLYAEFDGRQEQTERTIPLRRIATPDEQAATVAFLASDDASYVTGAVLDVNGGLFTA